MTDLSELRELSEAATPGPWPEEYVQWAVRHIARNVEYYGEEDFGWDRYTDGPFITAAVNFVREYLEETK